MLTINIIDGLIVTFSKSPEQAGGLSIKDLDTMSDKIFNYNGREVVSSSNEILTLPDTMQGLPEEFYIVGTGSIGLPDTLVCLGGIL